MMKRRFLTAVFLLSVPLAHAQKETGLAGSWKETQRTVNGAAVPYTDTLFMDLMPNGKFEWLRNTGFTYKGQYKAERGQLDMGMRVFTIVSKSKALLILKDEQGTYEFRPYVRGVIREDNAQASSSQRSDAAVGPLGEIRRAELAGNWEIYKTDQRTDGRGKAIPRGQLIRSINLQLVGGQASGIITTNTTGERYTVTRLEGQQLHCSGNGPDRVLEILKCADGELVIREGDATYFFKTFKQ